MANPRYSVVTSAKTFKARVDKLIEDNKPFGFDIESGFVGVPRKDLATKARHPDWLFVGFSYTNSNKWADYVPLNHDNESQNVPEEEKLEIIRDLYRLLRTGNWVAHNAFYELMSTSRLFRENLWNDPEYGPEIQATYGFLSFKADTMLLAYNLDKWHGQRGHVPDENGRPTPAYKATATGKGLKDLVWLIFKHKMIEFKELFVEFNLKNQSHARFNMLEVDERVTRYACEDSLYCLELYYEEMSEMASERSQGRYDPMAYNIDHAVLKPTFYMEHVGLNLDFAFLRDKLEEAIILRDEMAEEILADLSERLGREVNINLGSTQQVAAILYDELGIEQPKERGKLTRSTSEKNLQSISKKHKVIRDILTYRTVVKLIGSYLQKYVTELDYYGDGRAWPEHNTAGAVTGRFSVGGMSYQQLPKPYYYKLKNGREFHLSFRDAIQAPENYRIVGFDYSQIQLRCMAGMSGERSMLKAFSDGVDIHTATAAAMLKIPVDKVTGKQRMTGKAQPLYEKLLTPSGWVPMSDIKVGDEVIGSDGTPTKVTGEFPQEGKRPIYRITTSDGASVDTDEEHYLLVENREVPGKWEKLTVSEILGKGLGRVNAKTGYTQATWRMPDRPVVKYGNETELPIDPYFLGLLLGDGGFRGASAAYFASSDEELQVYVRQIAQKHKVDCVLISEREYGTNTYSFSSTPRNSSNPLTEALKEIGLWGVKGNNKFIPEIYLRASPEDRLALLQGILDTDGTPSYSGANLRLSSASLIKDVQELVRSLGGHATYGEEDISGKESFLVDGRTITTNFPAIRTQISMPKGVHLFRLERKQMKLKERVNENKNFIRKIEAIGEHYAKCISVEASDGLYVSNGYSVISNTLNFGIVFGQGPDALAETLTTPEEPVTIEDAEKLLEKYYEGFPGLKSWMSQIQSQASKGEDSYIQGLFGRRYQIWEYQSDLRGVRNKGDRMAVNEPVQGAEAYYMKKAMIQVHKAIKKAGLEDKIKMFMMVHDALEFYVHDSIDTQTVIDLLYNEVTYSDETYMQGYPEISSDWHEGHSLGSVIEIELDKNKKIIGYNVKAEVMSSEGLIERKFEGSTFEEVNSAYQLWKETEHPEVLNKKRIKEKAPNLEIEVETNIKNMKAFKELISRPGKTQVELVFRAKNVRKVITCGLTQEDLPEVYKAINEAEEDIPF